MVHSVFLHVYCFRHWESVKNMILIHWGALLLFIPCCVISLNEVNSVDNFWISITKIIKIQCYSSFGYPREYFDIP